MHIESKKLLPEAKERIYALGGGEGANWLALVERFDDDRRTWEFVHPMLIKRDGLAAVALGSRVMLSCSSQDYR